MELVYERNTKRCRWNPPIVLTFFCYHIPISISYQSINTLSTSVLLEGREPNKSLLATFPLLPSGRPCTFPQSMSRILENAQDISQVLWKLKWNLHFCCCWDHSGQYWKFIQFCYSVIFSVFIGKTNTMLILWPAPKIQQTKILVTCQRLVDLFLSWLVWQYSTNQNQCNKSRFKVMATY